MKRIILASESPRRREILANTNINFIAKSSNIVEEFNKDIEIGLAIENIALEKAKEVAKSYEEDIILGADTAVILDNEVLGKPQDEQEAREMLKKLSGKTHLVITGVAIIDNSNIIKFHETSSVTFYELDDDIIDWYISTKDGFDKAGSYGIQGQGAILVKEIKGDYNNIVGLPIAKVYRTLLPLTEL